MANPSQEVKMAEFLQALIMAFREGLEAFLIIAILLKFLDKTNNKGLKKSVWQGTAFGVIASLALGLLLAYASAIFSGASKLWESAASLIAVLLVTTFIIWMINHGSKIKEHVESKASLSLSKKGIILLALFMVAREGAEIAIFPFAGDYPVLPIMLGVLGSIVLVLAIYHSFVKINLKILFSITLVYLILQAGFLIGYSIHEGLSAAKGIVGENSPLYAKAFDLSGTALDHKGGFLGMPVYIAFGWYSKPEWIQFLAQYGYTLILLGYWWKKR